MTNSEVISKFYSSFSAGNALEMAACYHQDIIFKDPAFGELKGERAMKMWEMLLSNKASQLQVSFNAVEADAAKGSAKWVAQYVYGPKKRKVTNKVSANFTFKEGKIIEHTDSFSFWKWSSQALGVVGLLLGWTPYLKKKVQSITKQKLDGFIEKTKVL